MKKIVSVLVIFLVISLAGCSEKSEINGNSDTYFYYGESSSWFATYTITEDKSSYYDSLTIQYLFDEDGDNQAGKIGPIEYQLTGNSIETKSTYPQELQGVANFHTGTRINADMFEITFDEEMELLVKWQDKDETVKLQRRN